MLSPKLFAAAAFAAGHVVHALAADISPTEPANFNVVDALHELGIVISEIPNMTGFNKRSEIGCSAACGTLKFVYGDDAVETRNEPAYTEFVSSYWSGNQAQVSPYCVFKPSKPEQVAVVVLLSRLTQCPFAAKSGGHAAMAGASNAQDGITISFQNMKSIALSADKKIASIQPGNIWGDVYRELTKSDLNVIGGRIYDIGVGGLTTGGGISYFSNLHGWACDNVESYDVVTATGAIIRASGTQFPDLYWALRGGGNNFGLVVSFNLRTISLPGGKMWGGSRTYLEDSFPALSGAYANFIANAEKDPKAGLWHVYAYFNGTKLSLPTLYYAEPDGGEADIFSEWNAIPAISDTTQNRIIADWAAEGAEGSPPGPREIYSVISSKADKGLVDAAQEIYFEEVLAVTDLPGILPTLVFQGITIPMLKHMQQNGGNALGLNVEDGPFYIILLSIMWSNEEDDDKIYSFASTVMERIDDEAKARGLENDYIYMNYAAQFQDVVSGYGADNKAKLKSIAKKYDPKEVFQKLQPGYFKLDRAPLPSSKYFNW
ncbi:FAD binding domain-containing protein [Colletotrichum scovillei]|uniref:FAD binding domain-containing protein n=2 Tax=Colletotrichum scovillei TaxID=1209932 RepID=A0A9P7RBK9_9PEZI|nr:FAD binding domain-containing protein [Colletotrichum scovillei]KAF4772956.1 FAD binding domain-containing protein [Colletotrichum scovillei]KAG7054495.1 FAD binding domain-containing protein [Colletotrichum scovillei]KAG7073939.1 FAD binding domain-containing protein [Colletotrichum scovillei]KAG7081052.1 FAD binding domain-containing protein [Colletotrichum scovillei]